MSQVFDEAGGQSQTTMACQCSIVAVATSTDVFLPKLGSKISLDIQMLSSATVSESISDNDQYAFASTLNLVPYSTSPPLFLRNSSFLI
ncbi:MAG: hypothetical protein GXO82_08395 [Chlorobi bacterium]|nr:hypothetical protein [Chlorobiota bacterium]